jgi:hypothetical protein
LLALAIRHLVVADNLFIIDVMTLYFSLGLSHHCHQSKRIDNISLLLLRGCSTEEASPDRLFFSFLVFGSSLKGPGKLSPNGPTLIGSTGPLAD